MSLSRNFRGHVAVLALAGLLAACDFNENNTPEQSTTAQPEPVAEEAPPKKTHDELVEAIVARTPLSRLDLGEFPYFALPEGYRVQEQRFEWERTPYWVANGAYWVEGSVYAVAFFPEPEQEFSERSLREDIDSMITAAGGVRVADVDRIRMHEAENQGLSDEVQAKFRVGLGRFSVYPVRTYLLRVFDADVWIHFTSFDRGANLMMTAGPPLRTPGGRLLSGIDFRNLLDQDGRMRLDDIRFETGQAEITRHARFILDEVVELLNFNRDLQLAIDGHADERGGAERNLALSQERAEAVRTVLIEGGVADERLLVRGFGDHDPKADNTTDEGRAMNRRVSLTIFEEGDPIPDVPEALKEETVEETDG